MRSGQFPLLRQCVDDFAFSAAGRVVARWKTELLLLLGEPSGPPFLALPFVPSPRRPLPSKCSDAELRALRAADLAAGGGPDAVRDLALLHVGDSTDRHAIIGWCDAKPTRILCSDLNTSDVCASHNRPPVAVRRAAPWWLHWQL